MTVTQGYFSSPKGTTAALGVGAILFCLSTPSETHLGTGGFAANVSSDSRKVTNYLFPSDGQHKATSTFNEPPSLHGNLNAEKDLAHIDAILQPSITELATALDIARPTIYAWKKGSQIKPENSQKLRDMAEAADAFAGKNRQFIHQMLRRKIGGRNFFARVNEGESPADVAKKLLHIALIESRQREIVSAQLKDRPIRNDVVEVPGRHYPDENG